MHGGIQALHHLAGEERGHHVRLHLAPGVVLQVRHRVIVQPVLGHGITHQEHLAAVIAIGLERLLSGGHGARLQAADLFCIDGLLLGQFQREGSALCAQGSSGSGHAYPLQTHAQPARQPLGDGPRQRAHLTDIVDLAVHHGPFAMLGHLYIEDLQPVSHRPAHHAHHAARADIQGEDQVLVLHLHICHSSAPLLLRFSSSLQKGARKRHDCRLLAACSISQYLLNTLAAELSRLGAASYPSSWTGAEEEEETAAAL